MLCYIEKKNGTAVLLLEIENFYRSEFEPSRVTCIADVHLKGVQGSTLKVYRGAFEEEQK